MTFAEAREIKTKMEWVSIQERASGRENLSADQAKIVDWIFTKASQGEMITKKIVEQCMPHFKNKVSELTWFAKKMSQWAQHQVAEEGDMCERVGKAMGWYDCLVEYQHQKRELNEKVKKRLTAHAKSLDVSEPSVSG